MPLQVMNRMYAREEFRYVIVGAWNTTFVFAAFAALIAFVVPPLTHLEALVIASLIGICQSYATQRKFVWRSNAEIKREFRRFISVSVFQLAANYLLLWIFVDFFGYTVLLTQFFITGLLVTFSYFALKHWTFGSKASDNSVLLQSEIQVIGEEINER